MDSGTKRNKLQNAKYLATIYEGRNNGKFWKEVWKYIESSYNVARLKRIYLSGGRAPWIRQGAEYSPNTVLLLNRYHWT
mgnify:CR=1 FL=1